MEKVCISCKKEVNNDSGAVEFKCPGTKEDGSKCTHVIVRCGHCREISAKYKCPECGFEGP